MRPRSPYAVSKLAGEWYVRSFPDLFPIETVALRYFNVFGPRQRPDATYAAVIPIFATALLERRASARARRWIDHPGLHLCERCRCREPRRRHAPSSVSGNVYNIAPGNSSTLLELLGILGDIIGRDPDPQFVDPRPGDVPRACADASAAARDLGWSAKVSLADGLARYVEWLRR